MKNQILMDRINELRNQNYSYLYISTILRKEGFKVSENTIRKRYLEQFEGKNNGSIPKIKKYNKNKAEIPEDIIYVLRKNKISYDMINWYLNRKGIKSTVKLVSNACKRIFKDKGEEEPKSRKLQRFKGLENFLENLSQNNETNSLVQKYEQLENNIEKSKNDGEMR